MNSPLINNLSELESLCKSKGFERYTDLQESAFLDDAFFSQKDIFVISETSTGKTLIAQIAIALTQNQKALYLVPYRSLARQKAKEMQEFFCDLEVLISTAEQRECDNDILLGNVDIAVAIYEKAFMFSSHDPTFLDRYEIIIFDEFGIISNDTRSIKVDYLFWEVTNHKNLRTVILSTPNYNWALYADPNRFLIIMSKKRPVHLVKTDIIRKTCRNRRNKTTDTQFDNKISRYSIQLRGDAPNVDFHEETFTINEILLQICSYHLKIGNKILIFDNSKSNVIKIAKAIYQGLTSLHEINTPSDNSIEKVKQKLFDKMQIPEDTLHLVFSDDSFRMFASGISFHSASLPYELRREIENEFLYTNGILSIVCATETLAFGINSGTDVVIIASIFKQGSPHQKTLSKNDYYNYIGRAGRYGQRKIGYVYTIIPYRRLKYWDNVLNEDIVQIESKIFTKNPKEIAMYLLLFIPSPPRGITDKEIEEKLRNFSEDTTVDHSVFWGSIEEQLKLLERRGLIELDDSTFNLSYFITDMGKNIKGYIVDMDTFDILHNAALTLSVSTNSNGYFDYCYAIADCLWFINDNDVAFWNHNEQDRRIVLHFYFSELELKLLQRNHISETLKMDLRFKPESMSQFKSTRLRIAMILYLRMHADNIEEIANGCRVGYATMKRLGEQASYYTDVSIASILKRFYQKAIINKLKMISLSLFYGLNIGSLDLCGIYSIGTAKYEQISTLAECFKLTQLSQRSYGPFKDLAKIQLQYRYSCLPVIIQEQFKKGYGDLL